MAKSRTRKPNRIPTDQEVLSGIQRKAYKIAKFMGTENAKKLSQEQLTNMIMVTR